MKTINVKETKDIGIILDYVHDRIFELSKLRFAEKAQTLSIPLTVILDEPRQLKKILFLQTWKNPVVEATLLIKNVIHYSVEDLAQIDQAIINTITCEGTNVVINCSVPVIIRAKVARLELELVLSDTVTSLKNRFAFRGVTRPSVPAV